MDDERVGYLYDFLCPILEISSVLHPEGSFLLLAEGLYLYVRKRSTVWQFVIKHSASFSLIQEHESISFS